MNCVLRLKLKIFGASAMVKWLRDSLSRGHEFESRQILHAYFSH